MSGPGSFSAVPTFHGSQWSVTELIAEKTAQATRVAVVIPARNEAATVGAVVGQIHSALMRAAPLVDELIVMDSLSTDQTAQAARNAGAAVHSVADVRPELGVRPGKGEALWKSLFVTDAEVLVFVDADLLDWGVHFVTGLLGPLLNHPRIELVKGFYDRLFDDRPDGEGRAAKPQGGRVTELVARPLLTLRWPELTGLVQPLAGEWAIRRSLIETLPIPVGYGIELATLLDTAALRGVEAIAQVDLGRRAHRHQTIHDLGVMATEIIAVADRRSGLRQPAGEDEQTVLRQYERGSDSHWLQRRVPLGERPPRATID
ncbi:glucosyl-3-phosphoglycerate synthase [Jatrophihabitans sp. GAS493]|uniref:glucosyl-3-phosphoglycerate synthase n=1 Tax=Jatrophihabitans sp. GAS493 TaxID=1907575 RepID=UPI000BC0CA33|nr:glucosyl-3-phosphoglycerate synthase [Jatrophihabitans sp. GAS493]SOD74290.1 glucosyl-3-phosphoglycerate synthase [Jatrophihabitans sp. GAS493]